MESVASELKSRREKLNISLAQISEDTRISLRHLESLEDGRYEDLPGGMYNRAFLRAYCERLNIDQKEIVRRYEEEIFPLVEKLPKSRVHIPPQRPSFRLNPVIIWGVMLLISAVGILFSKKWIAPIFSPYFSHTSTPNVRFEPPKQLVVPPPASVDQSGYSPLKQSPPASALPTTPETADQTPSISLKSSEQPATAATPGIKSDASLSAARQPLQLEVSGTEKCWISIFRDGIPALRKQIEPGEVQSLNAAEKFFIVIGNAGGIRLKINGKPLKSLGQSGEVRRLLIDLKTLPDLLDPTAG
jgi:cytoskeleton protein RodZ